MTESNELIERLLADHKEPEDLGDENGLLKQLTKRSHACSSVSHAFKAIPGRKSHQHDFFAF
jgi:hypothetical protein